MSTLDKDFQALVARFEEGKPADPTEHMSPEDAEKWKDMNDEHGDKFKTANFQTAYKPLITNLNTLKNDLAQQPFVGHANWGVWETDQEPAARKLNVWLDDTTPAVFGTLNVRPTSLAEAAKVTAWLKSNARRYNVKRMKVTDKPDPKGRGPDEYHIYVMLVDPNTLKTADNMAELTAFRRAGQPSGLPRTLAAMKEAGVKLAEVKLRIPAGTRVVVKANPASRALYSGLPEDGSEGEVSAVSFGSTKRTFLPGPGGGMVYVKFDNGEFMGVSPKDLDKAPAKKKATDEDAKEGMFEKGKPADPTKEMSPEDAAEWKKNTEEHKDKFKTAATTFKFEVHVGPTLVKDVTKKLVQAGIDAKAGTEKVYGTIEAADKGEAADKINKASGWHDKLIPDKAVSSTFRQAGVTDGIVAEEHKDDFKKASPLEHLANLDLELTAHSLPGVALAKDAAALEAMLHLAVLDHTADAMIGQTILDQMGGSRRLQVMLGVKQFILLNDGVAFQWPNKTPSKGNYVEVKLNGSDLYDVAFYMVGRGAKKLVKKFDDLYAEDLVSTFERQTGWYLRMASEQAHLLVAAATKTASDEGQMARFEEGKPADPTENMSPEDAAEWKKQTEEHKDQFKTGRKSPIELVLFEDSVMVQGLTVSSTGRRFLRLAPGKFEKGQKAYQALLKVLVGIARIFQREGDDAVPGPIVQDFLAQGHQPGDLAKRWVEGVRAVTAAKNVRAFVMAMAELPYKDALPTWLHLTVAWSTRDLVFANGEGAIVVLTDYEKGESSSLSRVIQAADDGLMAEGCPDNLDESECKEWEANTEKYKDVVKDQAKTASGWEPLSGHGLEKFYRVFGFGPEDAVSSNGIDWSVSAKKFGRKTVFVRDTGVLRLYVAGDDGYAYSLKEWEMNPDKMDIPALLDAATTGVIPPKSGIYKNMRLKTATVRELSWPDGDRSAPWTPWGPAQHAYEIARGVRQYMTASHGGVAVAAGAARTLLTGAAVKSGMFANGYYWYEEDSDALIPYYEHPEWLKSLGNNYSLEKLEADTRRSHPRYFAMRDSGVTLAPKLKAGATLKVLKPIEFRSGATMKPGLLIKVEKVTGASLVVSFGGSLFKLPMSYYMDDDPYLALEGGGKTAYEEGSRIPDGWDNGHIEDDPTAVESEEGSDVPDGNGNQQKRAGTSHAGPKPTAAQKAEAKKLFDKWRKEVPEDDDGELGEDLDEAWQNFLDGDSTLQELKDNPPEYFKKAAEVVTEMYALVTEDGYMLGATDDWSDARDKSSWRYTVDEQLLDDAKLRKLVNVPLPLAEKFKDMGTSAQWYSDGYQAWDVAERFAKGSGVRLASAEKEAKAPSGLYGHTKRIQADCESCIRKAQKAAARIARTAYTKHNGVAEFLSVHAKRAKSLPAQILVSALKEIGPRVATQMRLAELRDTSKMADEALKKALAVGPTARDLWEKLGDTEAPLATVAPQGSHFAQVLEAAEGLKAAGLVTFDGIKIAKVTDADAQTGEGVTQTTDKEASQINGLYGFGEKVAKLGLQACTDLRHEAGKTAYDLHSRRAMHHAAINDFFSNHSRQARCMYSRLLAASYPEMRQASSVPRTVQGWLEWDPA